VSGPLSDQHVEIVRALADHGPMVVTEIAAVCGHVVRAHHLNSLQRHGLVQGAYTGQDTMTWAVTTRGRSRLAETTADPPADESAPIQALRRTMRAWETLSRSPHASVSAVAREQIAYLTVVLRTTPANKGSHP
jgi:predicted ArsR family transcriptional regulator